MDWLANLFGRHRLLLTCCVLAYSGICLYGTTRLTFDNDPLRLLRSDKLEFKWLGDDFAHLERTTLIVVEGEDLLAPAGVNAVRQIVQDVAEVQGVEAVHSMLSVRGNRRVGRYLLPLFPSSQAAAERFEQARAAAKSHPLLIGHLLSDDHQTALVIVQFDADTEGMDRFKEILDQLRATLVRCTAESGLRARLTGSAALQVDIVDRMRHEVFVLSRAGATLVIVMAMVLFRRVGAALLVAAGPAVGALWTMGTLGLIGEPINMLSNVVPLLVLVIGFTDSMHLVLHMRRALGQGSSGLEAAQSAIRHLGLACALTSLSTAVGFGSLVLASLFVIRTFGWCCALGSVLSFFAVITVVPLLASTPLSRYVAAGNAPSEGAVFHALADSILAKLIGHARAVLVCGILLCLTLAVVVTGLEPDHTIANEIPHSSESYRALQTVEEKFGGVMFAYAIVRWPQQYGLGSQQFYDVLEEVHEAFDASPVLSNPLSILNLVKSLPGENDSLPRRAAQLRWVPERALRRLLSSDRRQAVVSAHMPDAGARLLNPAFADLERQFEQLEQKHPGFHVELTGASVSVFKSIHVMIEDLWKSLATAASVMFLMIWVGLRSLRYALVSIMPNVFPLLCTGSFIVLSGRYLEMSSVIVFSISLGIAVDDTIHFLVRFKREMLSGADPRSAIHLTFMRVGTALVMTTVALVAGHAVVLTSAFPAVQKFGMLTALTIASALVGDLLFLPAILVCLKWPRN